MYRRTEPAGDAFSWWSPSVPRHQAPARTEEARTILVPRVCGVHEISHVHFSTSRVESRRAGGAESDGQAVAGGRLRCRAESSAVRLSIGAGWQRLAVTGQAGPIGCGRLQPTACSRNPPTRRNSGWRWHLRRAPGRGWRPSPAPVEPFRGGNGGYPSLAQHLHDAQQSARPCRCWLRARSVPSSPRSQAPLRAGPYHHRRIDFREETGETPRKHRVWP